jgi:hypothetical protein
MRAHECRAVPNPLLPTARSPVHEAKVSLPAEPYGPTPFSPPLGGG